MIRTLRFGILLLVALMNFGEIWAQDSPPRLFVLNGLGESVSVLDTETSSVSNDVVTVGVTPNRLHAHAERIYVVNSGGFGGSPGLSVIDGKSATLIREIPLAEGSNPWDMAFVGAEKAYVTNLAGNSVTVIDLASGDSLNSIAVGRAPEGILVANNTAYVSNTGGWPTYSPSTISVIDITADSVVKTLTVPMNPQDLALAPDGRIHVVCTGNFGDVGGKVAVIDPFGDSDFTALVVDSVEIGGSPGDIIVTRDGIGYLPDFGDGDNGFLYQYDAASLVVSHGAGSPIRVGNGPMTLLYDARNDQIWINNFSDDAVQLFDPATDAVLQTHIVGDGPQAMALLERITESDRWADEVVSFTPGDGAGFGQNYFPGNVLGPPDPDPNLNEFNPSTKPQELLSLGAGGEIVLAFTDNVIVNGEGPDFTVFENVFLNAFDDNKPFIEAAFVSVSMDGENFLTFPADTATFEGFAGVTPTLDSSQPWTPEVSGGDSFDLETLGLPFARFVKLTDLGTLKQEGGFNGDFDLDAVVAVNSSEDPPTAVRGDSESRPTGFTLSQNFPNPFNPTTTIAFTLRRRSPVTLQVFNLAGQLVAKLLDAQVGEGRHSVAWNSNDEAGIAVASGVYLYRLQVGSLRLTKRLTLIR